MQVGRIDRSKITPKQRLTLIVVDGNRNMGWKSLARIGPCTDRRFLVRGGTSNVPVEERRSNVTPRADSSGLFPRS